MPPPPPPPPPQIPQLASAAPSGNLLPAAVCEAAHIGYAGSICWLAAEDLTQLAN